MYMKERFFLIICLTLLSLNRLESAEIVRLANGEYPPYTSEQLPDYGIWSHIVTEAFAMEDMTVEYEFFPWKRALTLVQDGEQDGTLGFSKTPKRLETVRYSDTPLGNASIVFFYRKNYAFDWITIDDLKGQRIGVMQGYSSAEVFEHLKQEGMPLTLEYATTEAQNLHKLLSGRIDIFPATEVVTMKILHDNFTPQDIALITKHPQPWKEQALYVIFSKNIHRTDHLHQAFERGMKALKESGRYDQMMQDYVAGEYDKQDR